MYRHYSSYAAFMTLSHLHPLTLPAFGPRSHRSGPTPLPEDPRVLLPANGAPRPHTHTFPSWSPLCSPAERTDFSKYHVMHGTLAGSKLPDRGSLPWRSRHESLITAPHARNPLSPVRRPFLRRDRTMVGSLDLALGHKFAAFASWIIG